MSIYIAIRELAWAHFCLNVSDEEKNIGISTMKGMILTNFFQCNR